MFREHTCYCQVCACKEFAKVLAKKRKLTCPVCRREVDRIVVRDAADDKRFPTLRRCKSAVTVREKLEEEILGMHKAVVPDQRDSSSQKFDEAGCDTPCNIVWDRRDETMAAIRNLQEWSVIVQKSEVSGHQESTSWTVAEGGWNFPWSRAYSRYMTRKFFAYLYRVNAASDSGGSEVQLQQESPSQIVAERRQDRRGRSTVRRCMEALSAFKKLVYAISDHCAAEVQLEEEPSSPTIEQDEQNTQTYSMMGLCEEAMSALEKTAEELLSNCDFEIQGQQESTSQTVVEGRQQTQRGVLTKDTFEKTESAFDKLDDAIWAANTPDQQAPTDQTVDPDASSVRRVPLLHRCGSATFSWEKDCPFCQTIPNVNQESKCVYDSLPNCIVVLYYCNRHLCYCIGSTKKIVRMPRGGETRVCPFPFCRKPIDRVIMNAAPWKPRTVEEEIKECLSCKANKASKAAERMQKAKGSSSVAKKVGCKSGDSTQKTEVLTSKSGDSTQKTEVLTSKSGDDTQKTGGSTSKMKEEASKVTDRTQKTKSSAAKAKGETTHATDRAQKTMSSAPKAKEGVSRKPGDCRKSKGASSKATDPEAKATIPTCSVIHGNT